MTKILDRLPLFPATKNVTFGERNVRIHRDEVLVWVGIGLRGEERPLLGLPALRKNALDFWFDSEVAQCHLRTAGWRSKFIRLLHKL